VLAPRHPASAEAVVVEVAARLTNKLEIGPKSKVPSPKSTAQARALAFPDLGLWTLDFGLVS